MPRTYTPVQNEPILCAFCGITFAPKNARRRYCYEPNCTAKSRKARTVNADKTCTECGRAGVLGRGLCPTHYSYWYQANHGGRVYAKHSKECTFCASPFTTTTKTTAYCSLVCAQRHRAGWSTSKALALYIAPPKTMPPVVHTKTTNRLTCGSCRVCGDLFVSFETGVTCSSTCWKIRQRELRHEAGQRRRALKRNAYVSPVYRKNVFKSDGYRCHICNKMTNKNVIVPHPMAPTIDHVIPLAKGGTHEPINCRTAHFICNSTKGDRLAGDQMLLFAM